MLAVEHNHRERKSAQTITNQEARAHVLAAVDDRLVERRYEITYISYIDGAYRPTIAEICEGNYYDAVKRVGALRKKRIPQPNRSPISVTTISYGIYYKGKLHKA